MLEVKDVIQINATIIAGLLIFLTLVSINPLPDINSQINKLTDNYTQLNNQITLLQNKELRMLYDSDSYMQNNETAQFEQSESGRKQVNSEINQLESQLNQTTQQLENYNSTKNKITEQQQGKWTHLLETPQDWVYFMGVPFGSSAILAIISSVWDTPRKWILMSSYSTLIVGFGFIVITFIKIGVFD